MRWVLLYSPVYSKENEVPRNKICWKTQTRIKISKKSGSRIHALKHCVISIIFFFDKEMWETYICLRKRWLSRKWHDVFLIDFCYWSAATAKSHQSCPTLCNPIDCSPPGSHSWDSPGKNTGMDCHFLLQCMKVKSEGEVAQSCPTLSDPMDCSPPGSSVHGFSKKEP